ncbi:hypothetical protein [Streptomyces sp. NPDC001410]|uniref:hypothetical protein n=1 Tax=Streptomyces sp. NPDC001410 TaxID=3364574 RepID=UPI0036C4AC15
MCFDQAKPHPRARVGFHAERQDTSADGWQRLLGLIDEAADDGREEFRPLVELSDEERRQVITLPPSIAKLTAVKRFVLYGSNLVRIPPEIGAMSSLEEFNPLHLVPAALVPLRDHPMVRTGPEHGEHPRTVRELQTPSSLPPAPALAGLRC